MSMLHVSDHAKKSMPAARRQNTRQSWQHSAGWGSHSDMHGLAAATIYESRAKSGLGHDFGKLPIHADGGDPQPVPAVKAGLLSFQTPGPTTTPPAPTAPAPAAAPTVNKIDIVDSSTGAIGGYPAITSGDLNAPGPFNNAATGAVNNVHQMHFHLDHGTSNQLTPNRIVRGSNWLAGVELKHPADQVLPPGTSGPAAPGGFDGVADAPDGPAAHEIQRPSTDKIVIADAPGIGLLQPAQYPYIHKSTFTLTVNGPSGTPVARLKYGVRIEKKNAADIPNTENRVFAISKEDLVRGKAL
jgi:hypothetical protein